MKELYLSRDRKRGTYKTMLKLVEEVGELSEALLFDDKAKIEEEIADVIAWTLSIANLYDIDTEEAFNRKYFNKCPKCHNNPCTCNSI